MNFAHYLRIDREDHGRSKYYVVHTRDPKFSLELVPDREAADKIGKGVIKRLCLPNSCMGDYTKYSPLLDEAQEFFKQSFDEPAPKQETRRFQA